MISLKNIRMRQQKEQAERREHAHMNVDMSLLKKGEEFALCKRRLFGVLEQTVAGGAAE